MFNMGLGEMVVWGAIALIVIGPKQLPELARVVGRLLNEFKRATGDFTSSIAGVKQQAQSFKHEAETYMHKQKAEFEQAMKDHVQLDTPDPEHSEEVPPTEVEPVPHDPTEEELAEQQVVSSSDDSDKGKPDS